MILWIRRTKKIVDSTSEYVEKRYDYDSSDEQKQENDWENVWI